VCLVWVWFVFVVVWWGGVGWGEIGERKEEGVGGGGGGGGGGGEMSHGIGTRGCAAAAGGTAG